MKKKKEDVKTKK